MEGLVLALPQPATQSCGAAHPKSNASRAHSRDAKRGFGTQLPLCAESRGHCLPTKSRWPRTTSCLQLLFLCYEARPLISISFHTYTCVRNALSRGGKLTWETPLPTIPQFAIHCHNQTCPFRTPAFDLPLLTVSTCRPEMTVIDISTGEISGGHATTRHVLAVQHRGHLYKDNVHICKLSSELQLLNLEMTKGYGASANLLHRCSNSETKPAARAPAFLIINASS